MARIMLMYPPGRMFMRGEDRCQANIEAGTAIAMRACNDLGYAAAVLLKRGHELFLRDYQTEKATQEDLKNDIQDFQADLILLSTTNATIYEDIEQIRIIKKYSKAKIIFKGAIFYNPPFEMLNSIDLSQIDCLIGGEIETIIADLVDCFFSNREFSTVPGIVYKENGEFKATSFDKWEMDLDKILFPARQLMNNSLYVRPDTGETMATIQTSRGCPSSCIYCLTPIISGKRVRFRSPQNVFDEIKECYYNFEIKSFFFKADTFTINAAWVKELCELIINSPLNGKIEFTANSRVHPLKEETLFLMKKAGCFMIAFGFETGSEETLEKINKGASLEQAITARNWAKKAKLPVYGFFMIGFPWENQKHLDDTKIFIRKLNCEFIELSLALPFYGTKLYDLCKADGLDSDDVLGLDYFSERQYGTKYLSHEYLIRFRDNTILKYHLSPKFLAKKLVACLKNPKLLFVYTKYGIRMLNTK